MTVRNGRATLIGLPVRPPWSSLIAGGAKRIETRHWAAPSWLISQRIAIYATMRERDLWMCRRPPFSIYLPEPEAVPRGAIVGTVVLDRCTEMTAESIAALAAEHPHEAAFGWYEPGRFAWVLSGARPLEPAVPFSWPVDENGRSVGPRKFIDVPVELLGRTPEQGAIL